MITSSSNQKVKNVRLLISSKKERGSRGLYVIEGVKLFLEADLSEIKEVYVSESFIKKCDAALSGRTDDDIFKKAYEKLQAVSYDIVSDNVFAKMSDTVTPQGILSLLAKASYDIKVLCADRADSVRIIILEGLQDPGNLGTIIRTAEAAGFDFVIADNNTADVYSPKVIRSTMGAVFRMPVVYSDDLHDTVKYLKKQGVAVYAAHLNADRSYKDISYCNKCAVLVGSEGRGLSGPIAGEADELIKIPMHGRAESLNAAVAASLIMFEVNV